MQFIVKTRLEKSLYTKDLIDLVVDGVHTQIATKNVHWMFPFHTHPTSLETSTVAINFQQGQTSKTKMPHKKHPHGKPTHPQKSTNVSHGHLSPKFKSKILTRQWIHT